MTRHRTRRVAAALAATAILTACGGDDGGEGGGEGDATAQPPGTVAPPSTAAPTTTGATTTTSAPAPPTAESLASVPVALTQVATADEPVDLIVRPGTDERFVVERPGTVRRLADDGLAPDPLVDISADTVAEGERGLLGAAFSPAGDRLYLSYTDRGGTSRLDEWALAGDAVDPTSRRNVLTQPQPFRNHNGGHIAFGPDGLLWFGLGDGGGAGDPGDRAQDPGTLLGKILRIDPAAQGDQPYGVPGDNPFAAGGGRGEIAVLGVRNPWRFSFDRATGALWVGDVGQNDVEEVTALPAGAILGANLGWNELEGSRPFSGDPPPPGAVGPTYEYTQDEGRSVIGGFVYRGEAIPGLRGAYLFGDLAPARVWALPVDGTAVGERVDLGVGVEPNTLVSFAEDAAGEVYVLSLAGPVHRLDPG